MPAKAGIPFGFAPHFHILLPRVRSPAYFPLDWFHQSVRVNRPCRSGQGASLRRFSALTRLLRRYYEKKWSWLECYGCPQPLNLFRNQGLVEIPKTHQSRQGTEKGDFSSALGTDYASSDVGLACVQIIVVTCCAA